LRHAACRQAFHLACRQGGLIVPQPTQLPASALCRRTIIIAYHLSTGAQADEICVIDRGRIVERGRHGELPAQGGTYTDIAQTRFPHDAA
jgi:hypothetical protein